MLKYAAVEIQSIHWKCRYSFAIVATLAIVHFMPSKTCDRRRLVISVAYNNIEDVIIVAGDTIRIFKYLATCVTDFTPLIT